MHELFTRKNALLRYSLFVLLALPASFFVLFPQLTRCLWLAESSDFRLLSPTALLYVSRRATPLQGQQFQRHVAQARLRIRQFWGNEQGKAILIYCPNQNDYEQFCAGGEGAGCSLGLPWGASYLVLGPDGNNTDVIAHELCHDELFARLGWWRVKRQIPQWFNEGLALMVDYRFTPPAIWAQADSVRFNRMRWTDPRSVPHHTRLNLTDLETTRQFFGGSYYHTMLAYQTAADEVSRWLRVVGRAGVPALATAVANGVTFDEAYASSLKKHR